MAGVTIKEIIENQTGTKQKQPYEFLNAAFLEAMNDIGRHGFEKYGDDIAKATERKEGRRWQGGAIHTHASGHFMDYATGVRHDHFNDLEHQLAAVAFNAMMEFCFSGYGKK